MHAENKRFYFERIIFSDRIAGRFFGFLFFRLGFISKFFNADFYRADSERETVEQRESVVLKGMFLIPSEDPSPSARLSGNSNDSFRSACVGPKIGKIMGPIS